MQLCFDLLGLCCQFQWQQNILPQFIFYDSRGYTAGDEIVCLVELFKAQM